MKHLNYFLLVVGICLLAQCAQPDPAEIPEPALPADPAVESFGITPEDAAAEALAAREALSPATRGQGSPSVPWYVTAHKLPFSPLKRSIPRSMW